ncbi:hypothetical protein KCU89_g14482, partial [Aureobasidium melanogenum]
MNFKPCNLCKALQIALNAENAKRTAAGIPTWSPTVVLICRSTAYVWQSGRDAQFSADCGHAYPGNEERQEKRQLACHYLL